MNNRNVDWHELGGRLRTSIDEAMGVFPLVDFAWEFLTNNPERFFDGALPAEFPADAPKELISAYYGEA